MKVAKIYILLLVVVGPVLHLASCQKYVVISLKNTEPILVVDAELDAAQTEHYIILSESHSVYTDANIPATGAAVFISEKGKNNFIPFVENKSGEYRIKGYSLEIGKEYELKVDYNGASYRSVSKVFPRVEDVKVTVENLRDYSSGFTLDDVETAPVVQKVNMSFKDTDSLNFNHYRISVYIDSTKLNTEFFVTDKFINNEGFVFKSFILNDSHTVAYKGNKIVISVQSVTEQAFNFYTDFNTLDPEQQAGFNQKLGNPRSTFDNDAIGIFNTFISVYQEDEVE